jgi:hypothetical protein
MLHPGGFKSRLREAYVGAFDDREKAFENKYFHDAELKFKVTSRRNRLFGHWVAGQLGLSGAEADSYAMAVLKADFEEPGDGDVLRKVGADLTAKGKAIPVVDLERRLEACMAEAIKQLEAEANR